LHLGCARGRIRRPFLVLYVRASNVTLWRGQYVDREFGLENVILYVAFSYIGLYQNREFWCEVLWLAEFTTLSLLTMSGCDLIYTVFLTNVLGSRTRCFWWYSRTPLIRINWDGEPSGYAENPDNWIFFESTLHRQLDGGKISTNSGCGLHIHLRTNNTLRQFIICVWQMEE